MRYLPGGFFFYHRWEYHATHWLLNRATHQSHLKSFGKCRFLGPTTAHWIGTSARAAWESVFSELSRWSFSASPASLRGPWLGNHGLWSQTKRGLNTSCTFTNIMENCSVFQLPGTWGTMAFLWQGHFHLSSPASPREKPEGLLAPFSENQGYSCEPAFQKTAVCSDSVTWAWRPLPGAAKVILKPSPTGGGLASPTSSLFREAACSAVAFNEFLSA